MNTFKSAYQQLQAQIIAKTSPSVATGIRATSTGSAVERCHIYWQAYRLRFYEILKQDYPLTVQAMGESAFKHALARILSEHAPTSFNIDRYSIDFGELLATSVDASMAEVLTFERVCLQALHAPETTALTAQSLVGIPEQVLMALPLTLKPGVWIHIFTDCRQAWFEGFQWDSSAGVWLYEGDDALMRSEPMAVRSEIQSTPTLLSSSPSPASSCEPVNLMFFRLHNQLAIRALSDTECALLLQLKDSQTMTQLIEKNPTIPQADWPALFSRWLSQHILMRAQ
jgi:hypothetical protein